LYSNNTPGQPGSEGPKKQICSTRRYDQGWQKDKEQSKEVANAFGKKWNKIYYEETYPGEK
jgi:hypothetical protein